MALTDKLTDIADAIRAKTGEAGKLTLAQMPTAIAGITGGGGTCSGNHIIEVTELPTENIDENAVYLCGGAYYKGEEKLTGMLQVQDGNKTFVSAESEELQVIPTKIEDVSNSLYICYYIEDEKDFFLYWDGWHSYSELGFAFVGFIADESEATSEGYYGVINVGLTKLLSPTGTLTITENGTYDVTDYAKTAVSMAAPYIVPAAEDLPSEALTGSLAIVIGR